ncbi:hypothetical protein PA175_05984 [Pseudomonas aeruginosa]|nr:hypothetical protein PA175_05984 [Pseudomonas aeruginosa]
MVAQVVVRADQAQSTLVDAVHADVLASHAAQAAAVEHGTGGIAVLQPGNLVGKCRIGVAIDLGLGIGDHIEQCLGDGQVIALVAQVVVAAVQCQVALIDAIHTHVLACGAVQPAGQDRTGAVTVLQAADLVGQARVGVAVDLGLGIGDHIQQRLGDGQVVALVAQVVVRADQAQSTLIDAVHADVLASHAAQAAAVEHGTGGIAVLQPGNLVGQCRIGVAIDLGLGIGDHIQQRLGDGQVIALVAQVVVRADQAQSTLVDAVHADILASHAAQAAAVEHGTGGVAVLQAADLVSQARVGIAVDLGLGVGDHIQQCLGDGQVIALVVQGVIAADQAQSTLVDAVHADVLASHAAQAAAVEDRTGGIAALETGDLIGQRRIEVAIDLGLGIGDHVQLRRSDAQVVADVAEGVIGRVEAQPALKYPVVADVLPGHPAEVAAQHAGGGIAVLQATDLVGEGRIGVAIDLGLGVGADDQLRRRDGQLAVLAHQLVTLAEILAAIGVTGDRVLPDVRRLGRRGAGGRLVEVVELAVDVGVDGVDAGHRGRQSRIHITVDAGSVIGGQGGGLLAGKDVAGSGGGLEHLHLGALGEAVERSLAHEQVQASIDAAGLAAEAEDQFLGQAGADVVLQFVGHADHAAEALDAPTGAPVSGPGGDAAVAGGDGEPAGRTAVRGGGDVAAVDLVAQVGHQVVRRVVGRETGGTADPPIGQRGEHQAVELAVAVGGQRVVAGGADAVGLENPRADAGDDVLRRAGHALVDERIEHRAARGHAGGVALPVLERTVEGLQRQVAGVVVPGSQVDATGAAGEVGGDQRGTGLLADLAGGAGLHPQGAATQVDDAAGLRRAAAEEVDVAAGADCQAAVAEQDRRRDIHRTGRSGGDQFQAATGAAQVAGDQRRFHRQPVAGAEGHLAACQRPGDHRGIHRRIAAGAVGAPHRT